MENKSYQSHHVLHSYCVYPETRFESQDNDEKVILTLRAHPFTQIHWIVKSFLLMIVFILINIFVASFLNLVQLIFLNFFGLVIVLSYVWFNFLNWFFNVGIVTTTQIIDIDFSSILYKEVSAARLNKVEDVTSKSGGYFESFFDYGDLFVQTAGAEKNVEFMNIPKPAEAIEVINTLLGKK
ncbi:MAG: hypothetical protein UR15_C0018G0004 [Parcubacteria group bacterium GW2011_GWA2_31_28]|nr:MAG: hypothetical protein UR15_C0018G0004 [Parcubacteria group bacterium GW2011_GWA2_31_28]